MYPSGELAQLVERLHGMQEVSGSNPLFSTRIFCFLTLNINAMSQFSYSILQLLACGVTIFFLYALYRLAIKKYKISEIKSALFILIPYFIIGFLSYNVEKKRIGAVCCDDWKSQAKGSGACSSHGGVKEWEINYKYKEYAEPFNTAHKVLYFWYALNENHQELDLVSNCDDH